MGSPRVRGDVSRTKSDKFSFRQFSPRTRGCVWVLLFERHAAEVLPAYAGMFLSLKAGDKTI